MIKKLIMKKISVVCAIIFMFVFAITVGPARIVKATAGIMEAHIIDVGQGDSILIKLPDGKNMLIDGGPGTAESTVISYIQDQGISTLDYVVETHPHEDHIGGLDGVINTFSIGKIYIPNATATTQAYTNLMNAISAKGLSPITTHAGVIIFDTTYNTKTLKAVNTDILRTDLNGTGLGVYTSSGYYGLSSPSIKFQATGNQITTPSFNLSAAATLSFWLNGASTDANSHLLVEKYNGSSCSTVADIKPIPTTGTIKSYSLTTSYKQIRFTYTKSVGNIGIDDVKIQ